MRAPSKKPDLSAVKECGTQKMSNDILAPIFERRLSLDGAGGDFESRAMSVWERMADTLDQIAANTRRADLGHSVTASVSRKREPERKPAPPEIARSRRASTPGSARTAGGRTGDKTTLTPSAVANAVVARIAHAHEPGGVDRGGRRTATATVDGERTERAERTTGAASPRVAGQSVSAVPVTPTKSQQASAAGRDKRAAERQGNIIADAVVGGLGKLGDWGKAGVEAIREDSDARDAAGYAVAGPLYGVAKELRQVLPDSMKERLEGMKERRKEARRNRGRAADESGKKRDSKGRFLPDRNTVRRETTQIEIAEDELALQEREAKAEEKRHKELVRAIRTSKNKKGLLNRFMESRRGRDRIIRERDRRGRSQDVDLDVGRERGRGRGRTATRGPGRRGGGLLGRFGRLGRVGGAAAGTIAASAAASGGLLGGVGRAAAGVGRGTLALGAKGALGAAKAIPVAGQILAAGMALYDGFQGWNDTEMQREAFGLAEGQEASSGQKASTAIANVLDMGGLGTGLLGLLGVDVDTADIARSIYGFGEAIATAGSDFAASFGEKASAIWGGLTDMGSRIWSGAQEVGGAIASFAGDTLEKGKSLLTGIWEGATGFLGSIWSDLTDFAQSGIAGVGEMLSGLWKSASELPGKIAEGAKNIASSAIESGGKLLSAGQEAIGAGVDWASEKANGVWEGARNVASSGWDTMKRWGNSLFDFLGSSEAKAAEPDPMPASPLPEPQISESPAQPAANSGLLSRSLDRQEEMNEAMSSVDEAMQEQNKLLTSIDSSLNNQQLPDTFGIAGALGGVRDAIRAVRTGGNEGYAHTGASGSKEANVKILRERMAKGGTEAVQAGVSTMIAEATEDAKARNVRYLMGGKNSAAGAIDCSGWVQEMSNQLMAAMNEAMGQEVFSAEARQAFNKGARNEGAAGIVRAVSEQTGRLYTNEQLAPEMAKEGMVIGLDTGHRGWEAGRFKDIDHVVQTYRDPVTGELMVSESRGGKGVMSSRYADWYAQQQKRGTKLYGADLTAMADSSKVAPIQPMAVADATPSQTPDVASANAPASQNAPPALADTAMLTATPASTAQIMGGTEAQSGRQADLPVSVRTILPPQAMGGEKEDNALLLAMLGKILAAIEAGNRKTSAGGGDGTPSIGLDYDDPAMQGLARDMA